MSKADIPYWPLRVGWSFQYRLQQEWKTFCGLAYQSAKINDHVQVFTIERVDERTAEVVACLETRTYVRYRA